MQTNNLERWLEHTKTIQEQRDRAVRELRSEQAHRKLNWDLYVATSKQWQIAIAQRNEERETLNSVAEQAQTAFSDGIDFGKSASKEIIDYYASKLSDCNDRQLNHFLLTSLFTMVGILIGMNIH